MNLAEFARWAIENSAFAGCDLDGGSYEYFRAVVFAVLGFCVMFSGGLLFVSAFSSCQWRWAAGGFLCAAAGAAIFAHGVTLFLDAEYVAWTSERGASAPCYRGANGRCPERDCKTCDGKTWVTQDEFDAYHDNRRG